jgi:hypothetical protein
LSLLVVALVLAAYQGVPNGATQGFAAIRHHTQTLLDSSVFDTPLFPEFQDDIGSGVAETETVRPPAVTEPAVTEPAVTEPVTEPVEPKPQQISIQVVSSAPKVSAVEGAASAPQQIQIQIVPPSETPPQKTATQTIPRQISIEMAATGSPQQPQGIAAVQPLQIADATSNGNTILIHMQTNAPIGAVAGGAAAAPTTCEACVAAGRAWQINECQHNIDGNKCTVTDVPCYETVAACAEAAAAAGEAAAAAETTADGAKALPIIADATENAVFEGTEVPTLPVEHPDAMANGGGGISGGTSKVTTTTTTDPKGQTTVSVAVATSVPVTAAPVTAAPIEVPSAPPTIDPVVAQQEIEKVTSTPTIDPAVAHYKMEEEHWKKEEEHWKEFEAHMKKMDEVHKKVVTSSASKAACKDCDELHNQLKDLKDEFANNQKKITDQSALMEKAHFIQRLQNLERAVAEQQVHILWQKKQLDQVHTLESVIPQLVNRDKPLWGPGHEVESSSSSMSDAGISEKKVAINTRLSKVEKMLNTIMAKNGDVDMLNKPADVLDALSKSSKSGKSSESSE